MPQQRKHANNAHRQAAYRARLEKAGESALAAKGLPALPRLASVPGNARWRAALQGCARLLNLVRDEMADYFDDRSEAWQEGERGTAHQERVDAIDDLLSALEDATF